MRRAALLALLTLCGCDARVANEADAASDSSPLTLELGTGSDTFVAFAESDTLVLQRGCQGSQHVFVSLRVANAADGPLIAAIELRRLRDEHRVSLDYEVRLPFRASADGIHREAVGLTAVVPDPSEIVGEPVRIVARVRDEAGERAEASRNAARVRWGADACNPHG